MARTHALVIISVRPWLQMQALLLGVEGSGLVQWVSCRIRVSWISGNVHASDCGCAYYSGCVVNGISATTAC